MGRFSSEDSYGVNIANPLSLNLYTYCWNNPILLIDSTGYWPSWSQIGAALAITAVAVVSVAAVVATAGAAGAAVGTGLAMYFGASASTALTLTSVATAGAYAVAGGIALTAASDVGEVLTGHNVIRDYLLGGNQSAYDSLRVTLTVLSSGIICLGNEYKDTQSIKKIKSKDIRYTQDSIKKEFKNGNSLEQTIKSIKNGELSIDDFPPIRIFEKDGKIYSLDNRRLYIAKQLGLDINYVWATEAEVEKEIIKKFHPIDDGMSIKVRK